MATSKLEVGLMYIIARKNGKIVVFAIDGDGRLMIIDPSDKEPGDYYDDKLYNDDAGTWFAIASMLWYDGYTGISVCNT